MFKRKTWTEIRRVYTPGVTKITGVKSMSNDLARKLFFGFTSVELRCDRTGEIQFIEEVGDQRKD